MVSCHDKDDRLRLTKSSIAYWNEMCSLPSTLLRRSELQGPSEVLTLKLEPNAMFDGPNTYRAFVLWEPAKYYSIAHVHEYA
jgi:hypothetical protein